VPGSGPQGTPIVDEVTGETAFALERGQSVRQYVERTCGIPAEEHGVSLGGLIQGLVTGKGSPSIMASLDRGATSTGDMTVNSYLAAGVIDLLRARSVAVRAG